MLAAHLNTESIEEVEKSAELMRRIHQTIPSSVRHRRADTGKTVPSILNDTTTRRARTMTRSTHTQRPSIGAPPPVSYEPTAVEVKLAELTSQFELLKTQVRQAQQLAGLGTATATVAHEVSNLLTPVLAYAEYAQSGNDIELMKKALAVTAKNTRMLVRMSERVLELSSATSAKRGSIALRAVVDDAIESLCRDLCKDGIETTIDVDDKIVAWADHLQLQQVLFNLFLNAREAMASDHGGRLTVKAERAGDRVTLTVNNTGSAIPADVLPNIFDLLSSTKSVSRDGKRRCGGLGLALCKDLVEENVGTITATSDERNGTTFTISLPTSPG